MLLTHLQQCVLGLAFTAIAAFPQGREDISTGDTRLDNVDEDREKNDEVPTGFEEVEHKLTNQKRSYLPSGRAYGFPGMYGNSGMYGTPGMYGNSGMMGNPGMYGSPGMYGISGMYGTPGMYGNSGMMGNPGMYGSPGMFGSSGMLGSPGMFGMYGRPGMYGNPGMFMSPGMNMRARSSNGVMEKEKNQNYQLTSTIDEIVEDEDVQKK